MNREEVIIAQCFELPATTIVTTATVGMVDGRNDESMNGLEHGVRTQDEWVHVVVCHGMYLEVLYELLKYRFIRSEV